MGWLQRWVKRHYWRQDVVIYETTARCNLRCAHCYNIWKSPAVPGGAPGELPTRRACRLIDRACRDSRCINFTFTGGEPCLRDDLEVLVKRARRHCPHVNLITNGTLLDEARVEALAGAGVGLFELPLNAAEPELYDSLAGLPGAFDRVVRAAAAIKRAGAALAFVFVGMRSNIGEWPRVLELGALLGGESFLFNRCNAGGCVGEDPGALFPSLDELRGALAVANGFAETHDVGIGASIPIPPCLIDPAPYPNVGFGFCAAGTSRAYYTLDPLGNVRPCNHSTLVLGNIFEKRLMDMARGDAMRDFMGARPEFCSGCGIASECLGGCKAAAEQCYGDVRAVEPFLAVNKEAVVPLPPKR